VGPDQTSSFKIDDLETGTVLSITHTNVSTNEIETGSITVTSPTPSGSLDISAWQTITDELNASMDPIISKFNYNPVFADIDNNGSGETFYYILAVGKEYSKNYDFDSVSVQGPTDLEPIYITEGLQHVIHYNPTFDDTRVFKDFAEVERSTHVTIAVDSSKMPGLKNPTWSIKHATNPANDDIYYNNMWLTYIFKESGFYSIELNAEDTYGNKNVVKRNMIKVK
jgi:PKD repeat protein